MVIGKSNKEISEKLGVSERSAANYVGRIIEKLDAENRSEAIALAVWYQLTSWRPKSEN
jgi:DNA-binding CsgD family transcriptional regulator